MATKKKGVLGGNKISDSHSTYIAEAEIVISTAKSRDEVSKVVLGKITPVKPGPRRIKFVPIPAGFRITVRGANACQDLFVYTRNLRVTQEAIERAWEEAYE